MLVKTMLESRQFNPYRSETSGIAENAVRRVKEGTSALRVQSGLSEQWKKQLNASVVSDTRQTGRLKGTIV